MHPPSHSLFKNIGMVVAPLHFPPWPFFDSDKLSSSRSRCGDVDAAAACSSTGTLLLSVETFPPLRIRRLFDPSGPGKEIAGLFGPRREAIVVVNWSTGPSWCTRSEADKVLSLGLNCAVCYYCGWRQVHRARTMGTGHEHIMSTFKGTISICVLFISTTE
jgi:hypothetical protein